MDKRKLAAVPREPATEAMIDTARRLCGIKHIVTARYHEDMKILQLTFYEVRMLISGKPDAAFRTFLSDSDYITQDLKVSKVKWLTASFAMMDGFLYEHSHWNDKTNRWEYTPAVYINSKQDLQAMERFFHDDIRPEDSLRGIYPWVAIARFQTRVMDNRLEARHKKETDIIDKLMEPIMDAPQDFYDWVWETGMGFSRYVIYQEVEKGVAECECTYCKKTGRVDRKTIRMRNNEKGACPFCGSKVTYKAKGRLASRTVDERWFAYVDPQPDGFVMRYFYAMRELNGDEDLLHGRTSQFVLEKCRGFYTFPNGKPKAIYYEWAPYKQRGPCRWSPDTNKIACAECILYPGNLPGAWGHTPLKYSALEVLSSNLPTESLRYGDAITEYIEFPQLEWMCKMGLNNLVMDLIRYGRWHSYDGARLIDVNAKTIFAILKLDKVNTRLLQEVDGDHEVLSLLQEAQKNGIRLKADILRDYHETFGGNPDLLKPENRKASLHKILKYIARESERYHIGEEDQCRRYYYMQYLERDDPRVERKRNLAKDWLEYLKWCRDLRYDLNNMFIYMPTNFRKVHDRTYQEYQAKKDQIAAEKKKRMEKEAARKMQLMKEAMDAIFRKNEGTDAFSITGMGLVLVVPKSPDEIRAEGETLHHCVGSYVEKVARGETNIFFVRKASEPDKPYFTLEYRDTKVIQCRGLRNCEMPPDVKAFVKVFEKKMQDASTGEMDNKRKKAS